MGEIVAALRDEGETRCSAYEEASARIRFGKYYIGLGRVRGDD